MASDILEKVEDVYNRYTSGEGVTVDEVIQLKDEIVNATRADLSSIELLEAQRKVLQVLMHKIPGVMIRNGVKVEYREENGLIFAKVIE